jgi:hypothetical protein
MTMLNKMKVYEFTSNRGIVLVASKHSKNAIAFVEREYPQSVYNWKFSGVINGLSYTSELDETTIIPTTNARGYIK